MSQRVERRRAATRARLVAAAREIFARRGYHVATIGEITEAADVGFGTFYLYFPSKEALFAAVVEEGFARLQDEIDAARAGAGAFEGQQRAAIRAYLHFAYQNRDLFSTMFDAGALSHDLAERIQRPFEERIAAILQLSAAAGLVRPVNAQLMAPVLVAALRRAGLWWRNHTTPDPDAVAGELADFILAGLRP